MADDFDLMRLLSPAFRRALADLRIVTDIDKQDRRDDPEEGVAS